MRFFDASFASVTIISYFIICVNRKEKFLEVSTEINLPLTKRRDFAIIVEQQIFHGDAMVSTGIVRHDKRGGPGNPVIMPKLKN